MDNANVSNDIIGNNEINGNAINGNVNANDIDNGDGNGTNLGFGKNDKIEVVAGDVIKGNDDDNNYNINNNNGRKSMVNNYRISMKAFKMLGPNDTQNNNSETINENEPMVNNSITSTKGRLSKVASKILSPRTRSMSKSHSSTNLGSNFSSSSTSPSASTAPLLYVPQIVRDCCDYIRDHGIDQEGLFRISGSSEVVEKLQEMYQTKSKDEYGDMETAEIFHKCGAGAPEVASVLKQYIQNLSEPLIDLQTRQDLLALVEDGKKQAIDMRRTAFDIVVRVSQLPAQSKLTLEYILSFLEYVSKYQAENKMTGENLSRIFAPILFGESTNSSVKLGGSPKKREKGAMTPEEILQNLPNMILITEVLIANHRALIL